MIRVTSLKPRLFVDTEFNGFGGQLISMAVVSEDGREWYEMLPEPWTWDLWCFDNVFPVLDRTPMDSREFRTSFLSFMAQFENPEIIADWYTDMVHFFSMFAGKSHTESVAYACTTRLVLDLPDPLPKPSVVPHNALCDARAIRDAYLEREAA